MTFWYSIGVGICYLHSFFYKLLKSYSCQKQASIIVLSSSKCQNIVPFQFRNNSTTESFYRSIIEI